MIWNYKNENVKYDYVKNINIKNETHRARMMKDDREIIRFVWNASDNILVLYT